MSVNVQIDDASYTLEGRAAYLVDWIAHNARVVQRVSVGQLIVRLNGREVTVDVLMRLGNKKVEAASRGEALVL